MVAARISHCQRAVIILVYCLKCIIYTYSNGTENNIGNDNALATVLW